MGEKKKEMISCKDSLEDKSINQKKKVHRIPQW